MQNNYSEIKVSVQCITYNHEKYIRKCLDGFVMQKTNFAFEVIVHDDASTDKTPEIIAEYEQKYPFIKAIYQEVNQYSRGIPFDRLYIYPKMQGEYIAFCEGDDYWTNENKLQTLYDYISNHDECSMCCHAYLNIAANTEEKLGEVHTLDNNGSISMEKAIAYSNPSQLASQIYRRNVIFDIPSIFLNRGVGDYTKLLYAAFCGEIHYIDEVMACHRIASDGSWTQRVYRNRDNRKKHDWNMIDFLRDFNDFTEKKYEKVIRLKVQEYEFDIAMIDCEYSYVRRHPCFANFSFQRKCLVYIGELFPSLARVIFDKHDFS